MREAEDPGEKKSVERSEVERLDQGRRQSGFQMPAEPHALRGVEQERREERDRAEAEKLEERVGLLVLAPGRAANEVEREDREQAARSELGNARKQGRDPPDGREIERLAEVSKNDAPRHEPERGLRKPGRPASDSGDARQGVERDAHEEERGESEDLGVRVHLPVRERNVPARGDPNKIDHAGRRPESQRQHERSDNELR